jgi:hypothetical protein
VGKLTAKPRLMIDRGDLLFQVCSLQNVLILFFRRVKNGCRSSVLMFSRMYIGMKRPVDKLSFESL